MKIFFDPEYYHFAIPCKRAGISSASPSFPRGLELPLPAYVFLAGSTATYRCRGGRGPNPARDSWTAHASKGGDKTRSDQNGREVRKEIAPDEQGGNDWIRQRLAQSLNDLTVRQTCKGKTRRKCRKNQQTRGSITRNEGRSKVRRRRIVYVLNA